MDAERVIESRYYKYMQGIPVDDRIKPSIQKTYDQMDEHRKKFEAENTDPFIPCRQCRAMVRVSETVLKKIQPKHVKRYRVCKRCAG